MGHFSSTLSAYAQIFKTRTDVWPPLPEPLPRAENSRLYAHLDLILGGASAPFRTTFQNYWANVQNEYSGEADTKFLPLNQTHIAAT